MARCRSRVFYEDLGGGGLTVIASKGGQQANLGRLWLNTEFATIIAQRRLLRAGLSCSSAFLWNMTVINGFLYRDTRRVVCLN